MVISRLGVISLPNCWPIFKSSLRCSAESSSFSFGHSDIAKRCCPSPFPGPHPRFLKQTKFLHIIFTRAAAIVLPSPKLMCTQYTIFGQSTICWFRILKEYSHYYTLMFSNNMNHSSSDTIAESFYNVKYGSSIITSKVRQKISVMKT